MEWSKHVESLVRVNGVCVGGLDRFHESVVVASERGEVNVEGESWIQAGTSYYGAAVFTRDREVAKLMMMCDMARRYSEALSKRGDGGLNAEASALIDDALVEALAAMDWRTEEGVRGAADRAFHRLVDLLGRLL